MIKHFLGKMSRYVIIINSVVGYQHRFLGLNFKSFMKEVLIIKKPAH